MHPTRSSGNNGSDWGTLFAPPNSDQWKSYPASYPLPTLLSVANANCQGSVAESSQRNNAVSIAAPGTSVLSSVPKDYQYIRAGLQLEKQSLAAIDVATGGGATTAQKQGAYPEPRPIQDSAITSTMEWRNLVDCNKVASGQGRVSSSIGNREAAAWQVAACSQAQGGGVCLIGMPGQRDMYEEACAAMLACIDGGGSALVTWRTPDLEDVRQQQQQAAASKGAAGRAGSAAVQVQRGQQAGVGPWDASYDTGGPPYYGGEPDVGGADDYNREILPGPRLNCGIKCDCWTELQKRTKSNKKILPAIVIGKRQAYDILEGVKAAGGRAGALRGNVTVYNYPYRHYDGTSMAAPHVAGGAARVWAQFPGCDAEDVARALKESAKPLVGTSAIASGRGMLQVEAAYLKLKSYPCAAAGR